MRKPFVRPLLGVLFAAVLVSGPLGDVAMAAPPDRADAVEVYERDVFRILGVTLRNPDATTPPDAPLFTDSGINMDTTWGAWSAASAESSVKVKAGQTDVRLTLSGLIPNGNYSVFWGTLLPDSEQLLCPNVERTLPLDAVKPGRGAADPNSFVAGADGAASYHGQVDGDLFAAQQVYFSVVYHFIHEQSAYPFPNLGEYLSQGPDCRSSFGADSMRHLLVLQKW